MEAESILTSGLPYDKAFWDARRPDIVVHADKLLRRTFPWKSVRDTMSCFRAEHPSLNDDEVQVELPESVEHKLEDVYAQLKVIQRSHMSDGATGTVCVNVSDAQARKFLVTLFLAAVQVTVDHRTGAEPIHRRPLLRFRLPPSGRGCLLLCEMEYMLDLENKVETVTCDNLIGVFRWYRKQVFDVDVDAMHRRR
jgi:hypothetical protein